MLRLKEHETGHYTLSLFNLLPSLFPAKRSEENSIIEGYIIGNIAWTMRDVVE